MNSPKSIKQFEFEQQEQWRRDRRLRDRVPLPERWRGCLGLAVLLRGVEATCYHGDKCLIPNDCLRWMAARDVPPGCWYLPEGQPREVNYVNFATATLRHGAPIIDFTEEVRESWDFGRLPFGSYIRRTGCGNRESELVEARGDTLNSRQFAREFQVLNRISEQMTRFAFCALDRSGRPLRRSWQPFRPTGWKTFRPPAAELSFPVPYLAFPRALADRLFWLATESTPTGSIFNCPNCRCSIHSAVFKRSIGARISLKTGISLRIVLDVDAAASGTWTMPLARR